MQNAIAKYLKFLPGLRIIALFAALTGYHAAFSQTTSAAAPEVDYTLAYVLIMVMLLLLLVIWFLTKLLEDSSEYFVEKWKNEQREESKGPNKTALVGLLLLAGSSTYAQTAAPAAAATTGSGLIGGLPPFLFYLMISLVLIEFIIVIALTWQIWSFLTVKKAYDELTVTEEQKKTASLRLSWWDRFNKFRPMATEADIDMGHDYDGIRELDNKLPPWWLYGFYLTIVVGVIYFYRYHISHTGLSSSEEYNLAVENANIAKQAFLKESGNSVDENTVEIITDKTQIEAGMATFKQLCSVCHGQKGEGLVGPNLTDDYWLYGGGIKDVFKTIKYGTNKGMQSWKENLTPDKIAQVANYVKTLKGSNPPNAKAPDGTLYQETPAGPTGTDSTAVKK